MTSKVALRPCQDYETSRVYAAVAEAVNAVCDLPVLVGGKAVLIKLNLLNALPPERAVCTHPEVTRALVRLCREAGAREIAVGDQPGMNLSDNPEEAFEVSGNAAVCREEGARMAPFSRAGYREVTLDKPLKLNHLLAANEVLDAEVIINAPKLKSHVQALYTGAIKNWFGVVASRDRKRSHHLSRLEPFSQSLVDIFRLRVPELTVMDGIVGMEGRGPGEGDPRTLGLILASTDAPALDTVALHCIDYARLNVPHVRIAGEQGLGETDMAKIVIDGPPLAQVRVPFKWPPRAVTAPPPLFMKLLFRLWTIRPVILAEKCQVCGACERMCPVGAIAMGADRAIIDTSLCIECFCCHETCPHNAIGEHMSLLYRLHRWYERRKW
ncbi:MAG TPA: DUF362 domain-containing protein [bacterium]|nr:DUF362 domain-containing protein [bacterium]